MAICQQRRCSPIETNPELPSWGILIHEVNKNRVTWYTRCVFVALAAWETWTLITGVMYYPFSRSMARKQMPKRLGRVISGTLAFLFAWMASGLPPFSTR